MPRQQVDYNIPTYGFPQDFPEHLNRFQRESGLSWSEIARRIGTYRHTVGRWKQSRGRPNFQHRRALLELAESLGLTHLFISRARTPVGAASEDLKRN